MEGVRENEELVVRIEDVGNKGEGIGRANGYVLFVAGALPGELVRVRMQKARSKYGHAKLLEVLAPSKDRVEPRCKAAERCGGCQLAHMEYGAQLRHKRKKVVDCLGRIGGFRDADAFVKPVIGMEEPYRYRNKAQFPVGVGAGADSAAGSDARGDGGFRIGFYESGTHTIVETDDCLIQAACVRLIVDRIREYMAKFRISAYDERTHRGLLRHVLLRVGFETGEVVVCLVVNGKELPHGEDLVESLLELNGNGGAAGLLGEGLAVKGICLNVNGKKGNVILGERLVTLWGEPYMTDRLGDLQYRVSPLSFYQVNPVQTRRLYDKVVEYAGLTGKEVVWDLYCGIGTIGLYLAGGAGMVYGVEVVPQAIGDARENARRNGIANAEFFVGKAQEVVAREVGRTGKGVDVVVLDPPRKGCEEGLLQMIADVGVERVVYVSCDPATLARDLRYLCGRGYGVEEAQPVDMFPQTGHVETVCLLQRKPQ